VASALPQPTFPALKATTGSSTAPMLGESSNSKDTYPISQTLNATNPGPVSWPTAAAGRPTLTGGMTAGRIAGAVFFLGEYGAGLADVWLQGTPSALKNPSDETWLTDETSSRRKSTPGDASMRRSIQDLALSIDPNVKIEPEVEDVRSLPALPLITLLSHAPLLLFSRL
jgi:transcription initiation factor TFIID subunit 12